MTDTEKKIIIANFNEQKDFFNQQHTKDYNFRIKQLRKLKAAILKYEKPLMTAFRKDLGKSPEETFLTEISIVNQEIDYHVKHLKGWMKPRTVRTPAHLRPSSSKIEYEPLGTALIISPWNYPLQLLLNPLVGALSAGCTAVLKPSPEAPAINTVIAEMMNEYFTPSLVSIFKGGREINQTLLELPFDIIFFTGSPQLGKIVMRYAAEHLTPVILELGGKSPCVVDRYANLDIAAKRIIWGKMLNAGQTCIAPDYLFVHADVKEELLDKLAMSIKILYGSDIKKSPYYSRIVNQKAMDRLEKLIKHGSIVFGGEIDMEQRFIEPTVIDDIKPEHPVMNEEIFGPVLPVMSFTDKNEVIEYVNTNEKPLAFYYFGREADAKEIMKQVSFGGGCVNDVVVHAANHHLPFGGVGNSGIGKYHGVESFRAFCNSRAVVTSPTMIDLPFRYPPFKAFSLIRKLL